MRGSRYVSYTVSIARGRSRSLWPVPQPFPYTGSKCTQSWIRMPFCWWFSSSAYHDHALTRIVHSSELREIQLFIGLGSFLITTKPSALSGSSLLEAPISSTGSVIPGIMVLLPEKDLTRSRDLRFVQPPRCYERLRE